jgi:hypothetical protein
MTEVIPSSLLDLMWVRTGADEPVLFGASDLGVLRSSDLGQTWLLVLPGGPATCVHVIPLATDWPVLLAGFPGAISRSLDAGLTWEHSLLAMPDIHVASIATLSCSDSEVMLFAATLEDGLLVSFNSGSSWEHSGVGLYDPMLSDIAVTDAGVAVVLGESGLFASHDSGFSWEEVSDPPTGVAAKCMFPVGDTIVVGTDQGLWGLAPHDGGHWTPLQAGFQDHPVTAISVAMQPDNTVLVAWLSSGRVTTATLNGGLLQPIATIGLEFTGRTLSMAADAHTVTVVVGFDTGLSRTWTWPIEALGEFTST